MKQYDVVRIIKDDIKVGVAKGQIGTVLEDYGDNHFEIEINNDNGITMFLGSISGDLLEVVKKVNKLEVKPKKSAYFDVEHPTVTIDGVPLDKILHKKYPTKNLLGLVPTMINWIEDTKEKSLVKDRYNSKENEVSLPVLMCPDDCDLWCTVIVAKVILSNSNVLWTKIGIDRSTSEELLLGYDCIGTKVEWLDLIPQFIFDKDEYRTEISKILFN